MLRNTCLPQGIDRLDNFKSSRTAALVEWRGLCGGYLPMRRGFLYLVAIMDLHTRKVPTWRISKTIEADFYGKALNKAIHRFGPTEVMNTDQGSKSTSFA
ncbi:DDE-type integrase/transposase/recombinase [Gymnodinialimonas sp.]